jgi:hypothetical protein
MQKQDYLKKVLLKAKTNTKRVRKIHHRLELVLWRLLKSIVFNNIGQSWSEKDTMMTWDL